jgi:PAS domain S-box-containing protein
MRRVRWLGGLGLNTRVALLGVGSVLMTAVALVVAAVWQSGQYNRLAQGEVDELIASDLDHIAQGIYNLVQTEDEAVQQQVDINLNIARHVLARSGGIVLSSEPVVWARLNQLTGEAVTVQLPKMLVGGRWLGKNSSPGIETPVVDDVTRLVGGTATIFQRLNARGDMVRVATTVTDKDGTRAIGTHIPAVNPDNTRNPVIATVLHGNTYHGRAHVVDGWNLAAYSPITDAAGNLVGMLSVGVRQDHVASRIRHAVLKTRVGKTGYVFVLSGQGVDRGHYVISQEGKRDGEDIWDTRDSDGRLVVQQIINQATALDPGKLATVRYLWQNPGERALRRKIVRLAYYKPWDWVIGASTYEDELQVYRAVLDEGRSRMTHIMGMAGLALLLLVGLSGVLMAWTITRPVRAMTQVVDTIAHGDLSQRVDVHSRDEIGALGRAFNVMTGRLAHTIEGLHASEEKYRHIFDHAIEGLFQTTLDGRFLSANPAIARMLGFDSPEDMMASVTDLKQQLYVHPDERDALLALLADSDRAVETEFQWHRKDGQVIWVSLNTQAIRDSEGRLLFLQGFLTDVTKRRRAEEEVRQLTAELEERVAQRTAQLETANDDLTREIGERTQAEEALRERLTFENLIAGIAGDFAGRAMDQLDQGIIRALDGVGRFAGVDRAQVVLLAGTAQDMAITHEWCATGVGSDAQSTGGEPQPGFSWLRGQLDRYEPVHIAALADLPAEAEQERLYLEARGTKACVIVPLVCGGVLTGFLGFESLRPDWRCSDGLLGLLKVAARSFASAFENKWAEEQRLALELQLLHAQKLESVGQLAAGIAHEINTPTQFVGDNTRFLQDAFGDLMQLFAGLDRLVTSAREKGVDLDVLDEFERARVSADIDYLRTEIPKTIGHSLEGIQRISRIVYAMKDFSYPDASHKAATDLNRSIETTVTVARNEWKYVAEAKLDLDPRLPAVACFPGEINQVILNLIVNAAHAITEKLGSGSTDKGTITISTRHDGDMVEIRVADTGTGIPEQYRERMFTPFFTTKAVGKGTGQGLALAYNVIHKKHGGTIRFESEVGQGTTFIIRLPIGETDARA